jgi:hypothetical protein
MFLIISILMFATIIQADFIMLKTDLQKINQLESIVSNIKYINKKKISIELMPIINKFNLFCYKQFPQQLISYSNVWECWHKIVNLWNNNMPSLTFEEFDTIRQLIINWKYLNQEYVNLEVVLLEVIYTCIQYENHLTALYNKYQDKEKIIELMIHEINKVKIIELMIHEINK